MIVIVQTHAGNRFIGEIEEEKPNLDPGNIGASMGPNLPQAGEPFVLRYPLAYIERPNENGQAVIMMPPVILAGPIEAMTIVGSLVVSVEGSGPGFAQLRKAYHEAIQVVKAALSGIVRAHAGALKSLSNKIPGR